ncbi:hypothetical protein P7C73_g2940, partial [Tremellales sp. Uapishka_1]
MPPICSLEECCISASAPYEDILALLKLRGGIVIKGLIDPQDCLKIKQELQPLLDLQSPEARGDSAEDEAFFPVTTRKVAALITNSETFAHKIVLNPTLLAVAKDILTIRNRAWVVESRPWIRSDPQVNLTLTLEWLHRDDYTFNRMHQKADVWSQGRDLSILSFTACSKVTPENGGTMWIPGSHLWGEEESTPSFDQALSATMDVGDTFLTFHGGGTNSMKQGEKDSVRTLVGLGFCSGVCRQEENQFLSLDHEKLKKLPIEIQKLAGWSISQPNVGCVAFDHPLKQLGHTGKIAAYDENVFYETEAVTA